MPGVIFKIMKSKICCLLFTLVFLPFGASAQCSMCRAVLESEASQTAAEGINDGIVYLMIFPYLLMGGVAYFVWRTLKKDKNSSRQA